MGEKAPSGRERRRIEARADRLKAALRANLKRRKAQAQARARKDKVKTEGQAE